MRMAETMRVMGATGAGVEVIEIPKPTPSQGEVRVNVIAAAVNAAEQKLINGDLVGRFLHARTSPLVLGWDFAGTVDTLGDGVNDIAEGTAVWGHLAYSMSQKQGTYAEYITIPREAIATKPDDIPYHVAAATPTVALTSLQSLRDHGRLCEGGKALIIGAGGGIGSISVGIGKRLGGHVTGVCSTKDVDRIEALGADAIIDRKKSDPLRADSAYDLVFDTPAVHSFGRCAKILRAGGAYVTTMPGWSLVTGMAQALFTSKRCSFVQVTSKRADLELVGGWLSDGLEVPIDSRHKIADLGTALKRQADRGRVGRVVVEVAEGWPS
jgi:NADPH:quinone reductase-like Zn-dependent oxidoreductase